MIPILKSPDEHRVRISLDAYCHTCKHRHRIDVDPAHFSQQAFSWAQVHAGHDFEYLSTKRSIPRRFRDWMFSKFGIAPWWLEYAHNADLQLITDSVSAMTITLASLATSTDWTAGRQATSVSNASAKRLDYKITAKITTGTSPTLNTRIRLFAIGTLDDSPTWPDNFGSTDAGVTVTNFQILEQLPELQAVPVSASNNITYPFQRTLTIADALGYVPNNWTVFVSHNNAVNLNATGGNHVVNQQGLYLKSV